MNLPFRRPHSHPLLDYRSPHHLPRLLPRPRRRSRLLRLAEGDCDLDEYPDELMQMKENELLPHVACASRLIAPSCR